MKRQEYFLSGVPWVCVFTPPHVFHLIKESKGIKELNVGDRYYFTDVQRDIDYNVTGLWVYHDELGAGKVYTFGIKYHDYGAVLLPEDLLSEEDLFSVKLGQPLTKEQYEHHWNYIC